jgi:hypothetical protein
MRAKFLVISAGICALASVPASATVTHDNFLAKTTGDLVALCDATGSDPLYQAAMHFCEGFMVGAYQVYSIERAATERRPLFCPPTPAPTRDEATRMFVAWAHAHPQHMNETGIDSLFRFAAETWPCTR